MQSPGEVFRLSFGKRILLVAALAALGVGTALCHSPETAAQVPPPKPPPVRLGLATLAPEGTPWGEQLKEVKARIEKRSEGRLKVILYLGGRRGTESDMLAEVKAGKLQGAGLSGGALATEAPELEVVELPFLLRSVDEADHVMDHVLGERLRRRLEERGFVAHAFSENGWRSIGTRSRRVVKPADLQGLKVRAQESAGNVAFWRAVGAEPIEIPTVEVVGALASGALEGFDQTPVYMVASGWHGQIKHFTLTEHIFQPAIVIYGKPFLDGLPADLREILLADRDETTAETRRRVRAASEDVVRELGTKLEVIRLSAEERDAFRAASREAIEAYRRSPKGALLSEVEAALEKFRAAKRAGDGQ